jgi:hypothetical protein
VLQLCVITGIGIEVLLEAPTPQARLAGANGAVTGASISDSWMFAIVHEIAHQCFALGLQIRQLLEKVTSPTLRTCLPVGTCAHSTPHVLFVVRSCNC